jgi:hypothetical protein
MRVESPDPKNCTTVPIRAKLNATSGRPEPLEAFEQRVLAG